MMHAQPKTILVACFQNRLDILNPFSGQAPKPIYYNSLPVFFAVILFSKASDFQTFDKKDESKQAKVEEKKLSSRESQA